MTRMMVALSLIVVSACSASCTQREPTRTQRRDAARRAEQPPATPPDLTIPDDQLRIIHDSREALALLATRSPKAADLLRFYDQMAINARSEGPLMRIIDVPQPGQPAFFIVADPREMVTQPGAEGGGVFAAFSCDPPRMALHDGRIPQLVRGLFLAHELQHAVDCMVNGEPPSAFLDEVWLEGELNAHHTVYGILNEWSHGDWDRIVQASQQRRVASSLSRGMHPEATVLGTFPEELEAFRSTFHVTDDISLGFFAAQLNVDANLINVDIQMERYGSPEEERGAHYLEVLTRFYSQHQGVIQSSVGGAAP